MTPFGVSAVSLHGPIYPTWPIYHPLSIILCPLNYHFYMPCSSPWNAAYGIFAARPPTIVCMLAAWPEVSNLGRTRRPPALGLLPPPSFFSVFFLPSFLHLLWAEPNRLQVVILPLSTLSLFAVCTMVCPTSISRICTILLVVYTAQASQTLVRRTVDGIQLEAARRTHSLATDLRIAFSGILPRAVSPSSQPRNVVYCKPAKQVPVSVGPGGATVTHGNATSTITGTGTVTRTRTTGRSTATKTSLSPSPTATSPWNLLESHVSYPQVYIYRCSNFVDVTEWNHILRRLGLRHLCRSNAWFVQPFSLDNPPIHILFPRYCRLP